eukprot:sb/3466036/
MTVYAVEFFPFEIQLRASDRMIFQTILNQNNITEKNKKFILIAISHHFLLLRQYTNCISKGKKFYSCFKLVTIFSCHPKHPSLHQNAPITMTVEKDFRTNYLNSLGVSRHRKEQLQSEEIDLKGIEACLLESSRSKAQNRAQLWQFVLRIVPQYKTVRLHARQQREEQWSVLTKTAELILHTSDDDPALYLYSLHLINTSQLTMEGSPAGEWEGPASKACLRLVEHVITLLDTLPLEDQFFIVDAILGKVGNVVDDVVGQLMGCETVRGVRRGRSLREGLRNAVLSCYCGILPPCCVTYFLDNLVARKNTAALFVSTGVEILKRLERQGGDLVESVRGRRCCVMSHRDCILFPDSLSLT